MISFLFCRRKNQKRRVLNVQFMTYSCVAENPTRNKTKKMSQRQKNIERWCFFRKGVSFIVCCLQSSFCTWYPFPYLSFDYSAYSLNDFFSSFFFLVTIAHGSEHFHFLRRVEKNWPGVRVFRHTILILLIIFHFLDRSNSLSRAFELIFSWARTFDLIYFLWVWVHSLHN